MLRKLDRVLWIGPVALVMAACAWSVLDVGFSTDTWLGLAGGRQLMENMVWSRFQETFPRLDTYTYTFYGQAWINQNWLSHLGQYWLYDRLGPSAVVYGTWVLVACIHLAVLLAVYWRTKSWLAAWLAAALVGVGSRDFFEPRAAVVGLLCTATLWAMICAIEGQRDRLRWWPLFPLLPLLVVWSYAHGGFVFGYGLLALYVAHWVAVRMSRNRAAGIALLVLPLLVLGFLASSRANLLFFDQPAFLRWLPLPIYVGYWLHLRLGRPTVAASGAQILALGAILVIAAGIAVATGPFGIRNFGQPGKVTSSTIFRTVTEWLPSYTLVGDALPPMWRFWGIFLVTAGGLLLLWLAGVAVRRVVRGDTLDRGVPSWTVFDLAVVLIALSMTLWARRFAPLLYVLSAPVLAIWFMRLSAPVAPLLRGYGVPALKAAAALAAVVVGGLTWAIAHRDLVAAYRDRPETGLLERSRGHPTVDEAIRFVGENRLRVNLLASYGDGCSIMFHAPLARVFIDGRSEQLYTEAHFRKYWSMASRGTPPEERRRTLDATRTDAVLVRKSPAWAPLRESLESSPEWAPVLINADLVLFLRRGSPALARLGELVRAGREWSPELDGMITPFAQASRGLVLLNTAPADPARALDLLKGAVDRELSLGVTFYPVITRLLGQIEGAAVTAEYRSGQAGRLNADARIAPKLRSALIASLEDEKPPAMPGNPDAGGRRR